MALFGRRRDTTGEAIADFWAWWSDGGSGQVAMADSGPDQVRLLGPRVELIDPNLSWELAPGSESAHLLVVTADGDPDLRATARRWLAGAPPSDFVWSYADSRQPAASLDGRRIGVDGHEFDLGSVQVGVRRTGSRLDVTVYHPQMAQVPADKRITLCFHALDVALGEEMTETWIGELAPVEAPPLDGFGLTGLRAVVRDLRGEFTDENGEPQWISLQGNGPRGAVIAGAQVPLAAAWAPQFDQHIVITAPYRDRDDAGLPDPAAAEELERLRSHVTDRLEGQGRVVAYECSGGTCQVHVYAEGSTPAADQVKAAVAGWANGAVRVAVESDPGWAGVAHLRG
ncbi:DUF695 domain-containing protein [Flexivirga caeni]|nr:DUF695 domain-containing protein [Flexivirga caeni]